MGGTFTSFLEEDRNFLGIWVLLHPFFGFLVAVMTLANYHGTDGRVTENVHGIIVKLEMLWQSFSTQPVWASPLISGQQASSESRSGKETQLGQVGRIRLMQGTQAQLSSVRVSGVPQGWQ